MRTLRARPLRKRNPDKKTILHGSSHGNLLVPCGIVW